jgi:hypothetical protein
MDSRRRQEIEGCGTNAWLQGLGRHRRTGSRSNEESVLAQMEQAGDWTYGYGAWIEDEYIKLKNSLQTHGGKN